MDQFGLEGKVALVSGGARGMGAAIVETLAAAGAKVAITDVLGDEGEKLAVKLGSNTFFARLDVTKEADWIGTIAATTNRFGGLDILVNNAGIEHAAMIADCELEDFDRMMRVNAGGVFLGMKHGIRRHAAGRCCGTRWLHSEYFVRGCHEGRDPIGRLWWVQGRSVDHD